MRVIGFTFHVALALEDDEGVAATAPLLVADDSHPFNATEAFKLPPKVVLSGGLVLEGNSVR